MFGIGFFELIVIAIVAIVFVGPKKLPEMMRQAGRFFVHARRMSNEVRSTFNDVVRQAEADIQAEQREALKEILQVKEEINQIAKESEAAKSKIEKEINDDHHHDSEHGDSVEYEHGFAHEGDENHSHHDDHSDSDHKPYPEDDDEFNQVEPAEATESSDVPKPPAPPKK